MNSPVSVFLDFNLPNATTWFYFSWLLAVALFFKFARALSIRNWDVVTLFLLVPGLLVIQASRVKPGPIGKHPAVQVASLVGHGTLAGQTPSAGPVAGWFAHSPDATLTGGNGLWWGYLWLLCGSAYFLLRCLIDLTLVQRPALAPNLSMGGLVWLAGALLICLGAVAFRAPERSDSPGASSGPPPVAVTPASGTVGPEGASLSHLRQQLGAGYWLSRGFAVAGHLAVILGLIAVGAWHFQDVAAGMAAATFYLLVPYTGLYVGQAHHVWPMALVIWAIAAFKAPMLAGGLLGLAAGTMYFPGVLLPAWLGLYWKRGLGRFLFAFFASAGACLAAIAFILWMQNDLDNSIREAMRQTAWQPWKTPTTEGFWTGVHWAYRIPVFIAYAAFVLLTLIWPAPKNLAHVIALSAAVLIGIQFWYADQGGVYVLWYLPLLLLLVFRPNLEERRPAPIADNDWLVRLGRAVGRLIGRLFKSPETVKTK